MRSVADLAKIEAFMAALGNAARSPGRVYLTGGATALLHGWRSTTNDVDLKADPEPSGFFEAIASLKDQLDLNIELAAPDQFIPELPGWRDRSLFIAKHGCIEFYHYDLYSQALAKIERGHERDRSDVQSMLQRQLISKARLLDFFQAIEPSLIRYPAITPAEFRAAVEAVAAA